MTFFAFVYRSILACKKYQLLPLIAKFYYLKLPICSIYRYYFFCNDTSIANAIIFNGESYAN